MTCSSSTASTPRRAAPLLLVALLALVAGPVRAGGAVEAGPAISRAEAALGRGDGIAAEVPLRDAVRQGVPTDAVRAWLGSALLAQNDLRGARDVLFGGNFAPGSEALGWRARGELAIGEGDLPGAGKAFDQSLAVAPRDPQLWVDIARLRFLGGEQAQAFDAAQRAASLGPTNPRAIEMLALMVRERQGLVPSLPIFARGVKAAPTDTSLLANYAATLGDAGQYRQMLSVTRTLMQADPGNARGFYLQAVLAARAGQTELARRLMLKTGTALRDDPAAMLLNGVLEFRAGNINLSVEQLDRLARLQPDNLAARDLLARALARAGEWNQIVERFAADASRPGASPYIIALVARALECEGERDRAAPLLERASAAVETPFAPMPVHQPLGVLMFHYAGEPHASGNAVPLIRALMEVGDRQRALQAAIQLRTANPGSSDAQALVGDARMAMGDAGGAAAEYRAALAIRRTPATLEKLVGTLRAAGRMGDADAVAAQYLSEAPRSLVAMRLLAAGEAQAGRWQQVAAMLDALARRDQGGPLLLAQQSNAMLQLGDGDAAMQYAVAAYLAQPAGPLSSRALADAMQASQRRPASAGDDSAVPGIAGGTR